MTKYKLNNTLRSPSEVTLTSYMAGGEMRRDEKHYPIPELDSNQNDSMAAENNRNLEAANRCHFCPHSCEFLQQTDKLAASLVKAECDKFGLNELKVEGLEKNVCLCAKYNGGCRQGPRSTPGCTVCHGPTNHYTKDGVYPVDVDSYAGKGDKEGGWREAAARRARSCCSAKALRRRMPVLDWMPRYTLRSGLADLIAGVTVGLTVIPQAIAYAGVAGLPPQYGLYSSFMACFVYTILGSVNYSSVGPTAIAAILTRENLHGLGPEFAVLLAFLSGCVELLMGMLQLGFLIDFISGPVSVGFTSAAAIIIATTQIKDILGLNFPGGKFLQVWTGLYEHIGETRLWDSVLGVSCIVVLLLLRKVKDIKLCGIGEGGAVAQALWFVATTRNILVVVACAALAYYFDSRQQAPFRLTGEVKPGLPPFAPPPFSAVVGNHTYTFAEMASTLGSAIFVVPLLSILENIALAKVFSAGGSVDATQEMLALGACNVAASFVGSMPVSGALSRGAVSHASGVASPAAGLYTGALVLLSLQYFTPYFFYIPKASLAAVIIAAVVFMVELHVFKPIWRTRKMDIVPAVVTFVSCLALRLELGIVIGIAVNLLFLLYASARPAITVTAEKSISGVPHLVGVVDRSLWFPSAEFVRRALRKAAAKAPPAPLVLDAAHVCAADFTAAKGIKALIEEFHGRGQAVIFTNVSPALAGALRGVKPREFLHAHSSHELDALLRRVAARPAAPHQAETASSEAPPAH